MSTAVMQGRPWWGRRWLRWTLIVLALLAIAAYIALQLLTPKHASPQALSAEMKAQAQLTGGAKVYAAICAHCHDAKIGPSLRGRSLPPEAIALYVRNGIGAMPSFPPSQISDEQLAAVAGYIHTLPAAKE